MPKDDLIRFLLDCDDIVRLITGKRIPNLIGRGVALLGEEAGKKMLWRQTVAEPGSPYAVLGVRPDAADIVVKASYRALLEDIKDTEILKKIHEAYNEISKLREW